MKIFLIFLVTLSISAVSSNAGTIFKNFNDGGYHIFDDDTYSGSYQLSFDHPAYAFNYGTRAKIIDGASIHGIGAFGSSQIEMTGGVIEGHMGVYDNVSVNISGGTIQMSLTSYENSSMSISGGTLETVIALGNSNVTVSGCVFTDNYYDDDLAVFKSGVISLVGSDFVITNLIGKSKNLSYGDKLTDYATFVENRFGDFTRDYYTGTISGVFSDGNAFECGFNIYNTGDYSGNGDIVVIPEPCSILLLGIGGVMLRRKVLQ